VRECFGLTASHRRRHRHDHPHRTGDDIATTTRIACRIKRTTDADDKGNTA
jgi:hypothetical protein